MIHAYSEVYLARAETTLGMLFDCGLHAMAPQEFTGLFLASPLAAAWERGDARYLAGRSGDELFTELTGKPTDPEEHDFELSAGEWCGRVLCRAQWEFGCSFETLLKAVPVAELLRMFPSRRRIPVAETVAELHDRLYPGSALKALRLRRGLSQSQLALVSGVTLRSIRAYEQGDLDIAKAQYDTLCALAHSLKCSVPELMS